MYSKEEEEEARRKVIDAIVNHILDTHESAVKNLDDGKVDFMSFMSGYLSATRVHYMRDFSKEHEDYVIHSVVDIVSSILTKTDHPWTNL